MEMQIFHTESVTVFLVAVWLLSFLDVTHTCSTGTLHVNPISSCAVSSSERVNKFHCAAHSTAGEMMDERPVFHWQQFAASGI